MDVSTVFHICRYCVFTCGADICNNSNGFLKMYHPALEHFIIVLFGMFGHVMSFVYSLAEYDIKINFYQVNWFRPTVIGTTIKMILIQIQWVV